MKTYRFKITVGTNSAFIRSANFAQLVTDTQAKFKPHLPFQTPEFTYFDASINTNVDLKNEDDFQDIVQNAPNPANIELTVKQSASN